MSSDQSLLEAFRKQCRHTKTPWICFMAWKMSRLVVNGSVEQDDLIDIATEIAKELADANS